MPTQENQQDEDQRRAKIEELLKSGLKVEVFPRCDDDSMINDVIDRLQKNKDSLTDRLVIAGVTLETIEHQGIEQPCETCMYYLVHRRYCELPELDIPVEAQWSCRLWRI